MNEERSHCNFNAISAIGHWSLRELGNNSEANDDFVHVNFEPRFRYYSNLRIKHHLFSLPVHFYLTRVYHFSFNHYLLFFSFYLILLSSSRITHLNSSRAICFSYLPGECVDGWSSIKRWRELLLRNIRWNKEGVADFIHVKKIIIILYYIVINVCKYVCVSKI